jgi:hypothetical protein
MKWLLAGVEREVLRLVAEVVRQNILNLTAAIPSTFSDCVSGTRSLVGQQGA